MRTLFFFALLALSACGQPAPQAEAPAETATPPAMVQTAPRYVGQWAADESLCAEGAWVFEAGHVSTAGEVSCDLTSVRDVPGGYDIDATCLAEGETSANPIALRFPDSADGMLVEGGPWQPVSLIRCAP